MGTYLTRKRYKKKCIQGEVNLPYNTELDCLPNGMLIYNNLPVCYNTSQDAYDYFVRNDDGCGKHRGELIEEILKLTKTTDKKDTSKLERIWDNILNDPIISAKFKRKGHDVWLWNHDFYNADISDLELILNIIKNC